MRICIDSSVFIRGFQTDYTNIATMLGLIGEELTLSIPRLVAVEVTRNLLLLAQRRAFYALIQQVDVATISDEPIPLTLIDKYVSLGLPAKADAFIGAFAEWQAVNYLLSDNRHVLRRLQTPAFAVLSPDEFVTRWKKDEL
jgi:hypothetical protein